MQSLVLLYCVLGVSLSQQVTIDPSGDVNVAESNILTITCTDGWSPGSSFSLRVNGNHLTGSNVPPNEVNGMARIYRLRANRSQDGNQYDCVAVITAVVSPVLTLTVSWLDVPVPIPSSATIEENGIITVVVNLSGKPVPGIASFVRLDGVEIPRREDRIIINGNAIIIRNLAREDEGMYNITVSNNVASTVALFQLIVPSTTNPPAATKPPSNSDYNFGALLGGLIAATVVMMLFIVSIAIWLRLFIR